MLELIINKKLYLVSHINIKFFLTDADLQGIMCNKTYYTYFVRWLTEYSYSLCYDKLNKKQPKVPHNIYKLSISNGFNLKLSPFVVAHPCNLKIRKGGHIEEDSITENKLLFDIEYYGDFF